MLKALIFDVDDTLTDTERDGHHVAFNLAFQATGLKWHWDVDYYGQLLEVSGGKERILHYTKQYDTTFLSQDELNDNIKTLHTSKTQFYLDLLDRGDIPLRPGIERLLKQAQKAGLTLAIATATTPENVTALIKSTLEPDAIDWFASFGAGDMVAAQKPAPDFYNFVLDELSLSPEECIAFEDSSNGLCSATSAGLTTIITHNDSTQGHDLAGATLVLDQLDEPYLDLHHIIDLHATFK